MRTKKGKIKPSASRTLPLAEIILVCGFFFISAVEEILHHFLHPHRTEAGKSIREGYESFGETDEVNLKGIFK